MGDKAQALIERMQAVNTEVIRIAEGCSDEQWQLPLGEEDSRSVGVVFHHIATSYDVVAQWAGMITRGDPLPAMTREQLHAFNANHAQDYAHTPQANTVEFLRRVTAETAAKLQSFSDEQLDRTAPITLAGNNEFSAAWIVEAFAIGHAEGHLQSINEALAQQDG